MDGLTIKKTDNSAENKLTTVPVLLASCEGLEIMRQTILPGAVMWITPADNPQTMEFFTLLHGSITLTDEGREVYLTAGDSFFVSDLREEVFLRAQAESELLYVTNGSLFELLSDFQEDLKQLLLDINDKDHVTFAHSRQVQRYSIKLFQNLPHYGINADEMVTAALFHDVGKCFVPDEILKKQGKLEPDEWRQIMKHPHYSAKLLRPRFGEQVAEIAKNHHERLDGSGYPYGLEGSEISFASKIVAVADVYDAMTADRGYNRVKTPLQAVDELCSLPRQFDAQITAVLKELVLAGEITNQEADK